MDWGEIAKTIVSHSLEVTENQKVYIDLMGAGDDLVESLLNQVLTAGAVPFLRNTSVRHIKGVVRESTVAQTEAWSRRELELLRDIDAYIGIRSDDNYYEFSDLPPPQYEAYKNHFLLPMQHLVAGLNRWVMLKVPSYGLAQLARMSLNQFETIYFKACTMNYGQMRDNAKPLKEWLDRTDKVRIVAEGTDLQFSIYQIPSFLCDGRYNLPDGELFTAPVIDTAEGFITFNVPTSFLGQWFEAGQRMIFHKGKAVDIQGSDRERIWEILRQDEGAVRIGEFGIGLNPHIRKPMNNMLFDEKMVGSIHLALGQSFPMANNGNESAIHWDFVLDLSERSGGGKLYFDDVLVQQDGLFVQEELTPLN